MLAGSFISDATDVLSHHVLPEDQLADVVRRTKSKDSERVFFALANGSNTVIFRG
jgi:hypothetical protein